ncbi:MAG: hypothetical protein ACXW4M_14120, partial [Anaerolineales bacterium]
HPGDRFASVADFLSAWKEALEEARSTARSRETAPVSPPPPNKPSASFSPTPAPPPKAAPNSRGWAAWAAGCLVAICGLSALGGGAFLLFRSANQPPTETPRPTQTEAPPATQTLSPTETFVPPVAQIILEDDFSDDSIWGLLDGESSKIVYDNEALQVQVFETNWIVWTTPDEEFYENVHVEVTAHNNNDESTTAFGIVCYQQADGSSYYYAAIRPAGQYAIAKAKEGETDLFLTNNDEWGDSNLIGNKSTYRIGMDCANGILSLYVDGQLIDSVSDDSYTNGSSGLIVWSGEEINSADVSFDDFVMTSLP